MSEMDVQTSAGLTLNSTLMRNYFRDLVNQFFKILPMRENNEPSLSTYMQSLQAELIGCKELVSGIREDSQYLILLSILQYLIDNPECPIRVVKREVFKAISICNNLKSVCINAGNVEVQK